jgi:hypothetical protein
VFSARAAHGSISAVQYCSEHGSPLGREARLQPLEPRHVPASATGQDGVRDSLPDAVCRYAHSCAIVAPPPPLLELDEHDATASATSMLQHRHFMAYLRCTGAYLGVSSGSLNSLPLTSK